ncbi:hypothetical protein [Nonomuraea jabiensis]|uniref:hypothetical protein n=1 Tax=Nonomuraea jabiensis TaxID=882448 RepID=UPI00369A1401
MALCVLVFWLPIDGDGRAAWVHAGLVALRVVGMLPNGHRPLVTLGIVETATLAGAAYGTTQDPIVASAWGALPRRSRQTCATERAVR